MLSDDFLKKLDAITLRIPHAVQGNVGGARKSRTLGSSAEFSDFREYAPGDDIRRVDWNAYARFDKLYLKLFTEEQAATLTVLIDQSASMGFPGKYECGVKIALMFVYLALRAGDRVRIVGLGDVITQSPLLNGRSDYARAVSFLTSATPKGLLDLGRALECVPFVTGRGNALVISDFLSEADFTRGMKQIVYQRQSLTIVQVLSDEELDPTLPEAVRLIDSETNDKIELTAAPDVLRAYRRALTALTDSLTAIAHANGAAYALINAQDDFEKTALKSLLDRRVLTV